MFPTHYYEDICEALAYFGGWGRRMQIIEMVREIRTSKGLSIPRTFENVVQANMERYCKDSEAFNSGEALFHWPEGRNSGVWALTERGVAVTEKRIGGFYLRPSHVTQ